MDNLAAYLKLQMMNVDTVVSQEESCNWGTKWNADYPESWRREGISWLLRTPVGGGGGGQTSDPDTSDHSSSTYLRKFTGSSQYIQYNMLRYL
jgi:hypothetical protein